MLNKSKLAAILEDEGLITKSAAMGVLEFQKKMNKAYPWRFTETEGDQRVRFDWSHGRKSMWYTLPAGSVDGQIPPKLIPVLQRMKVRGVPAPDPRIRGWGKAPNEYQDWGEGLKAKSHPHGLFLYIPSWGSTQYKKGGKGDLYFFPELETADQQRFKVQDLKGAEKITQNFTWTPDSHEAAKENARILAKDVSAFLKTLPGAKSVDVEEFRSEIHLSVDGVQYSPDEMGSVANSLAKALGMKVSRHHSSQPRSTMDGMMDGEDTTEMRGKSEFPEVRLVQGYVQEVWWVVAYIKYE